MDDRISNLIERMTLEEKASLCSGETFWTTKAIERLGIPAIMMTDGPHGIRKQKEDFDHLGISESVPSTCFPPACALASSFDKELIKEVGSALGKECQAEDVSILLGPGLNIKRSPLWGRNFEYYSEDPILTGDMGAAWIDGVQNEGIGTCIKAYAAYNQEFDRMTVDVSVDERALREIYLRGFEQTVRKSDPWTAMSAYNKVNGTYVSEHKYLLTDILRDEWGFDGFVVTDWGAMDDRVEGIRSGLDLEMPACDGISDQKIVLAVKAGALDERLLDQTVANSLGVLFKVIENNKEDSLYDRALHHSLADTVAADCIVLLKNQDHILPLEKNEQSSIAIIGEFAKNPRYQGGGSSHITPTKLDNAYDEIVKLSGPEMNISYAAGYDIDTDDLNMDLIEEAKTISLASEIVLLFVGLPDRYESEAYDRIHMNIPPNQLELIDEISKIHENVIVLLSNGAAVTMTPWSKKVKGIMETWVLGQAGGSATAKVLFGEVNPSGRLSETFPLKLSDTPSYMSFPGDKLGEVVYQESVYVGYRYYDKKEMDVAYPFGYGLSYTTFDYSNIRMDKQKMKDTENLKVTVTITNTGNVFGKEAVQLYISDIGNKHMRPIRELKCFEKVSLQPGESKDVTFELSFRDFAYYEVRNKEWFVSTGDFEIQIGKSSRDICLSKLVSVEGTKTIRTNYTRNSTLGEILDNPIGQAILGKMIKPQQDNNVSKEVEELTVTDEMQEAMMNGLPLRGLISFSKGAFTEEDLQGLLKVLNS